MYKRRELKLHKDGYYDLAKEVIRQWNMDGRPRGDIPGINAWADIIRSHQQMMLGGAVRKGELHL